MGGMNTADGLHHRATEVAGAARAFHAGAEEPGSLAAAPDSLAALEEALQVLSAAWYQLAADASPGIVERQCGRASEAPSWPRFDGIPREQEVRLMGTLHDVAAAFARCAGVASSARTTTSSSTRGPARSSESRSIAPDQGMRLLKVAKVRAAKAVGTATAAVKRADLQAIELDIWRGRVVWASELTTANGTEYDVKVNARSGKVVSKKVDD
jgi:hypothetical protein